MAIDGPVRGDCGTMLAYIWESCGDLAQNIREECRAEITGQLKEEMEKAVLTDEHLEDMIRKGGKQVIVVSDQQ